MGDGGQVLLGSMGSDADLPRMAEVFPRLVAEVDRLLRLDDPSHPLAGTVGGLRFHGRCACTETCTNLLTAPPGAAGPYLALLERDGVDVIWLSLDPTCTTVVDIEVLEPTGLDCGSARRVR
ncbi:hypothetical protein ACQEVZ_02900 [Dactylosporangium sp. CA-152071]|uniref:hypothetical protein n=1 Tax=Dactylosporangium sp. CA-152071 TaxID=3239933 RepID=UPI003D93F4A3